MILSLTNDSAPITATATGASLGVSDLPSALHTIRCAWSDHRDIVALPSWSVVTGPGVSEYTRIMVEDRMAHMLFDLGNSAMDAWWGARNAIANSVNCASEPKHDALRGLAAGRPVLCVASGPTVADHIDGIRRAQFNGAIVVCADSIYQSLLSHGIEPDIVCVIERPELFAGIVPAKLSTRTILVCPPVVAPVTASGWERRRVWFWQETPGLYSWLGPDVRTDFSGRSAGTLAVAVSLILGGTAVYLVGHDLCRVGTSSHAIGVGSYTTENQQKAEDESPPMGIFAPCEVACRDHVTRKSTRFWSLCRQDIEAMLRQKTGIYAVDRRGSTISGAESVDAIPIASPAGTFSGGPLRATPSRYRAQLKTQIVEDAARFHAAGRNLTGADSMLAMQPARWAHPDTAELYAYILGTIYHAASLRMHLRNGDDHIARGMRVLQRGIPPVLQTMIGDLC
jgi:hypothetical protein